ncbi:Ung Uracil DNA glycosylase [Candidatus Nanopelagicaceae bacterium]|jgi:uracil-DNA glycosylase
MTSFRDQLHPGWRDLLKGSLDLLDQIELELKESSFLPQHQDVMKCLSFNPSEAKVLILGQDPYPNSDDAMGLAFSTARRDGKLPASLKNIFRELVDDLDIPHPTSGDLSPWCKQGVVLLNRTLTCAEGESNSHRDIGWREFTDQVVSVLAQQGVVAILWGANAQEVEHHFPKSDCISSVHPSPLSAYRGFFGSKPFSRANQVLVSKGRQPIDWSI